MIVILKVEMEAKADVQIVSLLITFWGKADSRNSFRENPEFRSSISCCPTTFNWFSKSAASPSRLADQGRRGASYNWFGQNRLCGIQSSEACSELLNLNLKKANRQSSLTSSRSRLKVDAGWELWNSVPL